MFRGRFPNAPWDGSADRIAVGTNSRRLDAGVGLPVLQISSPPYVCMVRLTPSRHDPARSINAEQTSRLRCVLCEVLLVFGGANSYGWQGQGWYATYFLRRAVLHPS